MFRLFSSTWGDFMPIRIGICDDTADDIELLKETLYAYDRTFEIVSYTDGKTLINDFLGDKNTFDILFLDIYMPGTDGIRTAEIIRRERTDIRIIFVTSSMDHYPQAYDVFAFNYVVKPFEREKLYRILDQAICEIKKENDQKIHFTYKSTLYSVNCQDILYIESRDKLVLFHKTSGETLQCYGKLDEIEKKLPSQSFIRCHKSFIVNISRITEMGENFFRLGQVAISISKKNLKQAKEKYYSYLFSHMGRGRSL